MKRIVLAVVLGIFAVAFSIVWTVQTHVVFDRAAESAADGISMMHANLEYQPEPELCRFAQEFVREWGDVATAAKDDLAARARRFHIDRISVVGTNGVVLASSVPSAMGLDFAANSETEDFLRLNAGSHFVTQQFRRPVDDPKSPLMKFVGIAFPDGGFVQIGDSIHADDMHWRDYVFEQSMQDEYTSYGGYFAIVDPVGGVVVSTQTKENTGVRADEAGFTSLDFGDGDGPVQGTVYGQKSLVWRTRPSFIAVNGYVIFPIDELMHERNVTVCLSALLLFTVLVVAYLFFLKVYGQSVRLREQNKQMEAFYAKEEADRQRDLALAKNIQASALPSVFPPYPGRKEFDLYAKMRTAKEVGGDFYDFYFVGSSKICLVMADVSGKGVPAALFMMRSKAAIKSSVTTEPDLAVAMSKANDGLCANNAAEMFVTAFVGVLDVETGELKFVSAGHNPPFIRHADGTVEMVKVKRALVLAAMEGARYREDSIRLRPGDRLFLYTDGVTEATAMNGELLGDARLEETLKDGSGGAEACCNRVIEAVDAFAGEAPQADDITVLAFDYKGCIGAVTRAFPASLEGLADATQFLQRRLDAAECSEKTKSAMMVAIDEIASNIVRYSGAPDFTVKVVIEEASVSVVFSDAGKDFNPLAKEDPDVSLSADERAIGGLGLFMVKRMMDDINYVREDGRNVLTIRKRRV